MAFTLSSASFSSGGEIPTRHTCDGDNVSPPLAWSDPPDGARSFALVVTDPDAPDPRAPRMTWVHWIVYNLPAATRELPAGVERRELPAGARRGLNDWKRPGYGGPCPPVGRHRYVLTLYALDSVLKDLGAVTRRELEAAMAGHVLAEAELVGTYARR